MAKLKKAVVADCKYAQDCTRVGSACEDCADAVVMDPPAVYENTGEYVSGMSPNARCIIRFPDRAKWEAAMTVLRCSWDGVVISPGVATALGLKPGTKVRVLFEVVK